MPKYICVPASYVIYELQEEAVEMMSDWGTSLPPQVVLEVLAFQGIAKKIGIVGSFQANQIDEEEGEEEEDPPEGEGPWVE